MEVRVVIGLSLLIGFSLGAAMIATTRVVTGRSLAQASDTLEAARSAFYALVRHRTEFAAAQTRLITGLPVFRAHLSDARLAGDGVTLDAMVDEYRQQLDAQFCILTDRNGTWTSNPGWPLGETPPPGIGSSIESAAAGRSHHAILAIGHHLMLVVSEPALFADEVLGTLTVGYALDDTVAEELAHVTHCEVNLVTANHLSGTSLDGASRAELAGLLAAGKLQVQPNPSLDMHSIAGRRYVIGAFPLSPDRPSSGTGRMLLLEDWQPTQRFLDELSFRFLRAGGLIFLFAVAAGVLFSRRMTRPFRDIAAAAGDIAAGNWTRQVPVRGGAESTTMALAFNEMSTHLRHWRQEAQDRSARLEASHKRFSSVTESARDAIISTDHDGTISFWSRSAGTIFGYTEAEAIGQPLTRFVAESDRHACLAALTSTGPDQADAELGRTIEVTGVRKDGVRFPIELSVSAWQTGGGTHFTAVVRDITERKQGEDVLRQREDQLRQAQKMEAIGRLAGGVAHDFNNLLTAIRGYGELVLETLEQDDPRRLDADEIIKASDRAAGLTRQLLTFSRRRSLAPQVLALDEVLAGTERILRRLIGEDINLTFTSEAGLGHVRADAGQIEQVLVNLVVNARDAMPSGGKLSLELSNVSLDDHTIIAHGGSAPGAYVCLKVADTGCGMSADVASHIFEPFFTTKEEGKGTGLGLATAYGIVQQSGGTIEVDSRPGEGTVFRIYLPQVVDMEPEAVPAQVVRAPSRGAETILLAEDDDSVRTLVATVLRKSGYIVLEAVDGEHAIELMGKSATSIHLLLTDVVMPGMSGRILSERVTAASPDTRVLFMSGYSPDAMVRHGVPTASAQFIQKPFAMDALQAKVREALGTTAADALAPPLYTIKS
jgi:PAS domain S-box-containing protein